jgi:hypothetical protein
MAPHSVNETHEFDTVPSQERRRSISTITADARWAGIALAVSLVFCFFFVIFLYLA